MKPAIALFARAPEPGRVKTRLIGRWSPEQVGGLYRAFVLDTWTILSSFAPTAKLFLYVDREHGAWRALAGERLRLQRGNDLGRRMLYCFEDMHAAGFGPLLIVGSDSPALTPHILAPWTDLLARAPAVLGPAEDGGYYAIGCREPDARMFAGVEWSSPQTLDQTVAALARCGMSPAFLEQHYDIDTPADVARLAAEPNLGRHTHTWLQQNGPKASTL